MGSLFSKYRCRRIWRIDAILLQNLNDDLKLKLFRES